MVYVVKHKQDFEQQLNGAGNKLVVVSFCAEWCGPCKMIAPVLASYAEDFRNKLVVLKVDVDACEDLAHYYNISSMPTFVFIKNGNIIDEFSGASSENLSDYIIKYIQ